MEDAVACVLVLAVSFPVSYYLTRGCLSAVIHFIGGAKFGAVAPHGSRRDEFVVGELRKAA